MAAVSDGHFLFQEESAKQSCETRRPPRAVSAQPLLQSQAWWQRPTSLRAGERAPATPRQAAQPHALFIRLIPQPAFHLRGPLHPPPSYPALGCLLGTRPGSGPEWRGLWRGGNGGGQPLGGAATPLEGALEVRGTASSILPGLSSNPIRKRVDNQPWDMLTGPPVPGMFFLTIT